VPDSIDSIRLAVHRLREGGVVAFPTETVYGLGADAFNPDAVRRVFELKGRPSNNPLIVHVSGPDMARRVVAQWTPDADRLARAFWPGPLSIILPKAADIPATVTAGGPNVAVRCPNHPTALALLFELDTALVGPSANLSGAVSPTSADHVRAAFPDADLLVLDGGPCSGGIESTVLSLADPAGSRILRPGLIGPDELAGVLARPVIGTPYAGPLRDTLPSPGLLERHYAPGTPAHMFHSSDWPGVLLAHPGPLVILTHASRRVPEPHALVRMPADAHEYAAVLYAALREADALGVTAMLIEEPPTDGPVWHAIADRLRRATTPAPPSSVPPSSAPPSSPG
jgi:L-threonylcarbamoyladenylate synthase